MILHRRTFFQSLFGIGVVAAPEASRVFTPAPESRGLEAITVYCPQCTYHVHPVDLGRTPPYITRELCAPVKVACVNPNCGHEFTAQFVREV